MPIGRTNRLGATLPWSPDSFLTLAHLLDDDAELVGALASVHRREDPGARQDPHVHRRARAVEVVVDSAHDAAPHREPTPVTDAHGNPPTEVPLTDPDVRAPSHAERARTLASRQATGTLATLDPDGFPHASYVTYALDGEGPVFLISKLATHTQHLARDPRSSLMAHETGADDPLANGRVTLLGRCERVTEPASARAAFLAVHPGASYYVDFADFGFFRLVVSSIRYIGGYGRMSWVDVEAWRAAAADPLAEGAEGILRHMNDDHAEALRLYARAFTRATDAERAVMTGIDRYGFEMSVETPTGRRPARVAFASDVTTSTSARQVLVALVEEARLKLGATR
jgi:putative heme iron utilization protein